MTVENKLKSYILSKYKSVNEFSQETGIPQSTVATIFKRGVNNSSVGSIIKICTALNISTDELAKGNIVSLDQYIETYYDDTEEVLQTMRRLLAHSKYIDGEPASKEELDNMINAIDVGVEIAKRKKKRTD